jgi:hypothetical protein
MEANKPTDDLPPPYEVDLLLPAYSPPTAASPVLISRLANNLDTSRLIPRAHRHCTRAHRHNSALLSSYLAIPPRARTRAQSLGREEYAVGTHPSLLPPPNVRFSGPRTTGSRLLPASLHTRRRLACTVRRETFNPLFNCFALILMLAVLVGIIVVFLKASLRKL